MQAVQVSSGCTEQQEAKRKYTYSYGVLNIEKLPIMDFLGNNTDVVFDVVHAELFKVPLSIGRSRFFLPDVEKKVLTMKNTMDLFCVTCLE